MIERPSFHIIGNRLKRVRASKVAAAAALGLTLIGFATFVRPSPWLVWNASPSAPLGLYRAGFGPPKRGDLALIRMPAMVGALADQRGYLPRHVPLVKRVAALPHDHVCAFNEVIVIAGEIVAHREQSDRQGRPLPWWNECRRLADNEVFLINGDAPGSFDSRYFGPVLSAKVIERLVPLWTE